MATLLLGGAVGGMRRLLIEKGSFLQHLDSGNKICYDTIEDIA